MSRAASILGGWTLCDNTGKEHSRTLSHTEESQKEPLEQKCDKMQLGVLIYLRVMAHSLGDKEIKGGGTKAW